MDFSDTNKPRSNLPSSSPPRRLNIKRNVRGSGAIIMAKDTGQLLFALRASRLVGVERPREWNLWGGRLYLHKSPEMGVIRNAKEQTGYKGDFADVMQLYSFISLYTNFRYYTFLLVVENEFTPTIDKKLIDHYQWVEYGNFPTPLHPAVKTLLDRAGHKIKAMIDKNFLKESLIKDTSYVIKLKDLLNEIKTEIIPYTYKNVGPNVRKRNPLTGEEFQVGKYYSDGDVLYYIMGQHEDFEDDFRVNGVFQCLEIDPKKISESEWFVDASSAEWLARSGKPFPPIVVDNRWGIIDGGHRLEAAKLRGDKKIKVLKQI